MILLFGCVETPMQPESNQFYLDPRPQHDTYFLNIHVERNENPIENARLVLYIYHHSYTKKQTTYYAKTNYYGNYYWSISWEEVEGLQYELKVYEPSLHGAWKKYTGRIRFGEEETISVNF